MSEDTKDEDDKVKRNVEFSELPQDIKDKWVSQALELTDGFLICGKVWEAWAYGTMNEGDFAQVGDDPEVIQRVAEKLYKTATTGGVLYE